ncbi:MAG: urease accessory protein UreD [Ferruginibacter sp.]|nr:urease accessory protein UreD [Ferruginibacter sp.]
MIAQLHIEAAVRDDRTYLKSTYYTTPLKVANITEDKKKNRLHLMLMSSSPGILDGDQYQLKIDLAEGTSLQLHTQSYQRLFNMKKSATQSIEVHLALGGSFCFLPHPSVPHTGSVFTTGNKFFLSENCSLVFGEILTCGRKLNGEVFLFSKYHSITEIYLNNKLVIKENLLIEPATMQLDSIGQLEGFTHQASLIYINTIADISELTETISRLLADQEGTIFGITAAPLNGLIIRMLGNKAEQLHDCLKAISNILPQEAGTKSIEHAV